MPINKRKTKVKYKDVNYERKVTSYEGKIQSTG